MAKINEVNLERTFYCVITGASQGIGRALSLKLSAKFKPGSLLVLLARSEEGLNETKLSALKINPLITVVTKSVDLSKPNANLFRNILIDSLQGYTLSDFDTAMIVHNAGSVGDVSKKVIDLNDFTYWQDYYALNVFGVSVLNSEFFKIIGDTHNIENNEYKTIVVNITSLLGIQPFKNLALYGSGKAAREMIFRVLAEEEKNVLVLNYAPGPVDTDMIKTIIDRVVDADMKQTFVSMRDENKILTTDQTTSKFLEVLQNGNYKSGQHVDYFD